MAPSERGDAEPAAPAVLTCSWGQFPPRSAAAGLLPPPPPHAGLSATRVRCGLLKLSVGLNRLLPPQPLLRELWRFPRSRWVGGQKPGTQLCSFPRCPLLPVSGSRGAPHSGPTRPRGPRGRSGPCSPPADPSRALPCWAVGSPSHAQGLRGRCPHGERGATGAAGPPSGARLPSEAPPSGPAAPLLPGKGAAVRAPPGVVRSLRRLNGGPVPAGQRTTVRATDAG